LSTIIPGGVDCDLHPALPGIRSLLPYLNDYWQDQVVSRYPGFSDLVDYCRLSANPVGRIVLHVFGLATPVRVSEFFWCPLLAIADTRRSYRSSAAIRKLIAGAPATCR